MTSWKISAGMVAAAAVGLTAPVAATADGKGVYDKACTVCHASGVGGAPKLGDKAAWATRVSSGKDVLVASVVKGKGAMPPKAGNAQLSDEDIKSAVDFLLAAVK